MKKKKQKEQLEPYFECLLLDKEEIKELQKNNSTPVLDKNTRFLKVFNSKYKTKAPIQ